MAFCDALINAYDKENLDAGGEKSGSQPLKVPACRRRRELNRGICRAFHWEVLSKLGI